MTTPPNAEEDSEVQERLVRVETKLDVLIQDLATRHRDQGDRTREHEGRIRGIETSIAEIKVRVAMVSSLIGTAAGVVAAVIVRLIGG